MMMMMMMMMITELFGLFHCKILRTVVLFFFKISPRHIGNSTHLFSVTSRTFPTPPFPRLNVTVEMTSKSMRDIFFPTIPLPFIFGQQMGSRSVKRLAKSYL